jgi:hypothetical protein
LAVAGLGGTLQQADRLLGAAGPLQQPDRLLQGLGTRRRSYSSGLPPRPPVLAAGNSGAGSAHGPSVIVEPG